LPAGSGSVKRKIKIKKQNLDFDTDEFSMGNHIVTAIFILRPYLTQHYARDMSDDLVIKINSSAA
jgi:hypothetical protein